MYSRAARTFWIVIALVTAGREGVWAASADRDACPVPVDALHTRMSEVGTPGGRFVVALVSPPRTFNPLMASEATTLEVTNRLYAGLVAFNNVTQQRVPALAKSW